MFQSRMSSISPLCSKSLKIPSTLSLGRHSLIRNQSGMRSRNASFEAFKKDSIFLSALMCLASSNTIWVISSQSRKLCRMWKDSVSVVWHCFEMEGWLCYLSQMQGSRYWWFSAPLGPHNERGEVIGVDGMTEDTFWFNHHFWQVSDQSLRSLCVIYWWIREMFSRRLFFKSSWHRVYLAPHHCHMRSLPYTLLCRSCFVSQRVCSMSKDQ